MNTSQAKKIPITDFLAKNGIKPTKENSYEAWYHSPITGNDKTASFRVNKNINCFRCFASDERGTIVDLGTKMFQISISEFLAKLDDFNFSFRQQKKFIKETKIEILNANTISSRELIDYAWSRKINSEVLIKNCFQVNYIVQSKRRYSIGFKNLKGGYEFRHSKYKGCSGIKAITHLKNNSNQCCLFEGFFDYLSFLILKKESFSQSDYIILNGVGMIDEAIHAIKNYNRVFLFFDNDTAGYSATKKVIANTNTKVVDYASLYLGFKDLNEYLIDKQKNIQN